MSSGASIDDSSARRDAALHFLLSRINYERMQSMPTSEAAFKLDRMRELLERLGNPQDRIPIVHVAGTKGKGSTAAMIAAALSAAGYRAGLFTSPHLERIEERWAIDGRHGSPDDLIDLIERVRPAVESVDRQSAAASSHAPTYFEITTAMALLYFVEHRVDVAVLEVGLGGRLDSTNVCRPLVSVITSISLDHTKQLGETLAAIAGEKAGIIKPGVPVVSGVTMDEPREVIRQVAQRNGAHLIELGRDFDFDYHPALHMEQSASVGCIDFRDHAAPDAQHPCCAVPVGLLGRHQAANAAIALAVLEELRRIGWNIPEAAVRSAWAGLTWPARVEVIARHPAVVLDAAHNAASIAALMESLDESFAVQRRFLIFATTREKDLPGMLKHLLGRFDQIVFTQYLNNSRAVPPAELQDLAAQMCGLRHPVYADPAEAWAAVRCLAGPDDLLCIAGSFFIAAEMRRIIASPPSINRESLDTAQ